MPKDSNLQKKVMQYMEGGTALEYTDETRFMSTTFNRNAQEYIQDNNSVKVLERVNNSSRIFITNFLKGVFDSRKAFFLQKKDTFLNQSHIRLYNDDREALIYIQRILLTYGIFSKIYDIAVDRDKRVNFNEYGERYELFISSSSLNHFRNQIGFRETDKRNRLVLDLEYTVRRVHQNSTKFKSLTYVGKRNVYDCTIPRIGKFAGNGIILHNCGEQISSCL